MTQYILFIIVGLLMLVWGGDRFVTGASGMARNLGVSPLLIGLTIVAFGTSAPEIFVSIVASLKGSPGIAIGNAIGSNITNVGLVLGLTACLKPIEVHSDTLKREYPILFLIMGLVFCLFFNGFLGRLDGVILLSGMVALIIYMVRLGLAQRESEPMAQEYQAEIPSHMPMKMALLWVIVGLIFLPIGSELMVEGASGIARHFGVSDLIIGLTIVAIGTSLPELMASVMGVLKGEDDIAIGNVLGSNMFNLLAVLGFPALIHPTPINPIILIRDFPTMLLLTVMLYAMSYFRRTEHASIRWQGGILLLATYTGYMVLLGITA